MCIVNLRCIGSTVEDVADTFDTLRNPAFLAIGRTDT